MSQCTSVFDEDGIYKEREDVHECQLETGHLSDGFAHKCHCGVTWIGSIATTADSGYNLT